MNEVKAPLHNAGIVPHPVGPIISIFFGTTSALNSSPSSWRRHRFRNAMATALFAASCPTICVSSSSQIFRGVNAASSSGGGTGGWGTFGAAVAAAASLSARRWARAARRSAWRNIALVLRWPTGLSCPARDGLLTDFERWVSLGAVRSLFRSQRSAQSEPPTEHAPAAAKLWLVSYGR